MVWDMSPRLRTALLLFVLVALFALIYALVRPTASQLPARDLQSFYSAVEEREVHAVYESGDDLEVTATDGSRYKVHASLSSQMVDYVASRGVEVHREDDGGSWTRTLIGVLVVFVILALIGLAGRRIQGGAGGVLGLRKTTARLVAQVPNVGFEDVGGAEEVKTRMRELVALLKDPRRASRVGARLPRGILLEGPPGFGKTLLARALAGEAKVPFFETSGPEFVEVFVGVGAARVRDLFEQAARKSPCVIFIDEVDALGRKRSAATSALMNQEREQALNQLLTALDGFAGNRGIVVVAATNRADVLDPALLRPGRFDLRFRIDRFSEIDRRRVLDIHAKGKSLAADVDLDALAAATDGLSGAELEHVMNEAALAALRAGAEAVHHAHLKEAARAHVRARFDAFDAFLAEADAQLAQPIGEVRARVLLSSGESLEGALLWGDPLSLKLECDEGSVVVDRRQVVKLEPLRAQPLDAHTVFQRPRNADEIDAA
jgi:cell division protease FtsH